MTFSLNAIVMTGNVYAADILRIEFCTVCLEACNEADPIEQSTPTPNRSLRGATHLDYPQGKEEQDEEYTPTTPPSSLADNTTLALLSSSAQQTAASDSTVTVLTSDLESKKGDLQIISAELRHISEEINKIATQSKDRRTGPKSIKTLKRDVVTSAQAAKLAEERLAICTKLLDLANASVVLNPNQTEERQYIERQQTALRAEEEALIAQHPGVLNKDHYLQSLYEKQKQLIQQQQTLQTDIRTLRIKDAIKAIQDKTSTPPTPKKSPSKKTKRTPPPETEEEKKLRTFQQVLQVQAEEQEKQERREELASIRALAAQTPPPTTMTGAESPSKRVIAQPFPKKEQWQEKKVIETSLVTHDWQEISGKEHIAKHNSAKEKIKELAKTGHCGDYRGILKSRKDLKSTVTIDGTKITIDNILHAGIGDEYRLFYTFVQNYLIILQVGQHDFEDKRLKMNYEVET